MRKLRLMLSAAFYLFWLMVYVSIVMWVNEGYTMTSLDKGLSVILGTVWLGLVVFVFETYCNSQGLRSDIIDAIIDED